jgi:hypothetical protein
MDHDSELPDPCPEAPWPFVQVRWHDACADHNWSSEEETPNTVEIITRGWRISNTKRGIKIVASYYRVEKKWVFGEVVAIPRKMLITEEVLECLAPLSASADKSDQERVQQPVTS